MQRYRIKGRLAPYGNYLVHPPKRPVAAFTSYTPRQIVAAYGFTPAALRTVARVKFGFGSLGGIIDPADTHKAFGELSLLPPVVRVIGAPQQADPGGADLENALDLDWQAGIWEAGSGLQADVTVAFAPNASGGMAQATRALVDAGCEVISWSWGSPDAPSADREGMEAALAHARSNGAWVLVASGDNSADDGTGSPHVDYPSGSALAWAVGGTRLLLNLDGSRRQESAWGDGNSDDAGTGGGFDPLTPQPAWQAGVVPGSLRGCPDSAAPADPEYGAAVCVGGQWTSVGGTSWAAPTTAAIFALLRGRMKALGLPVPPALGPWLYAHPGWFYDIVLGGNGLPTAPGWDAATGLGSPNGAALLAALGSVPPPAALSPQRLRQIVDGFFGWLEAGFPNQPWMVRFLESIRGLSDAELQNLWAYLRGKGIL